MKNRTKSPFEKIIRKEFLKFLTEVNGVIIVNFNALKEANIILTLDEKIMLQALVYLPFPEKASNPNDKSVIVLDPICVALYDYIHGFELLGEETALLVDPHIKIRVSTAKSIFVKYNPVAFKNLFN